MAKVMADADLYDDVVDEDGDDTEITPDVAGSGEDDPEGLVKAAAKLMRELVALMKSNGCLGRRDGEMNGEPQTLVMSHYGDVNMTPERRKEVLDFMWRANSRTAGTRQMAIANSSLSMPDILARYSEQIVTRLKESYQGAVVAGEGVSPAKLVIWLKEAISDQIALVRSGSKAAAEDSAGKANEMSRTNAGPMTPERRKEVLDFMWRNQK